MIELSRSSQYCAVYRTPYGTSLPKRPPFST